MTVFHSSASSGFLVQENEGGLSFWNSPSVTMNVVLHDKLKDVHLLLLSFQLLAQYLGKQIS
jgi:hypothetical protein